jgi:hypothetical protein
MHKTLIAALVIAALGFATVGAYADDTTTAKTTTKTEKKTKKAPKKAAKSEKTTTTTETK